MSLSLLKSYSLPYERLAQLQAHSRRESLRFNPRSLVPPAIFYRNMFSDKNVLYRAVVLVARKIGQQWPELYLSLPFKPPRSRDTLLQDIEECRQNRGVAAANKWTYAVALRTGSGPGAASVSSGPGAAASGSGYASGSDSASVLSLSDEEGDDDGALVSSRGPGARESRAGFGGRRSRREPHIVYQMPASLKPVMERVRARLASRNTNYAGSRVGAGAVPRFPLGPLEEPAADDGLPKVMPRDGVVALSCLKRWLVFNASPSVEQLVQALEALGRRDVREALEDHIDSTFLGSSHTI